MQTMINRLLLLMLFCTLLLPVTAMVSAAQEGDSATETSAEVITAEEPTVAAEQPPQLTTCMFVIGLLAIVTVGGAMIARDRYKEEAQAA